MEKVIGVNELRPKLGKYLDEAEKGRNLRHFIKIKAKGRFAQLFKIQGIKRSDRKSKAA
ncbi:MAG: hypothetical protein RQM89_12085 [Acetomicrobium sp.]